MIGEKVVEEEWADVREFVSWLGQKLPGKLLVASLAQLHGEESVKNVFTH